MLSGTYLTVHVHEQGLAQLVKMSCHLLSSEVAQLPGRPSFDTQDSVHLYAHTIALCAG